MVEPINVAEIQQKEKEKPTQPQINTKEAQEKRFEYNFEASSPLKAPKELSYSHFSRRYKSQLSEHEVFSMRFNSDSSLTAITFSDGSLQIISSMLGDRLYQIHDDTMKFPITNLAWKPTPESTQDAQKLLCSMTDGSILIWTSSMANSVQKVMLNEKNQYHAIDYANDQRRFSVAGTEPYIEIWDEVKMKRVQQIGDKIDPAHTNKIYTCRFHPSVSYMMYSGSWDRQIHFWDLRANKLVNKIGGKVQINGDAVDVSRDNNYVVTGGGTLGEGVQLWDMRELSKSVKDMPWNVAQNGDAINPVVNVVRFVPYQDLVVAGASDEQAAKCFSIQTGDVVEHFTRVQKSCFTLDCSMDSTMVCFGDGTGAVHYDNVNYGV